MHRRHFLFGTAAATLLAGMPFPHALAQVGRGLDVKDGETVVFLGDSITEQRLYTTYIESYLLTRYPNRRLTFRNTGWGGDTAWLRQRMQGTDMSDARLFMLQGAEQEALLVKMVAHGLGRDVLPLKPTTVLIDFGMNDARRGDAALPVYARATAELVTQLRKAGVRPVLLTPSPEERNQEGQPAGSAYNLMLEKYSAAVKDVATREKLAFADQFHPYVELVDRARKTDPMFKTMPDGVHPFASGHLVMAWGILKGLGADPLVSEVSFEKPSQRKPKTTRAKVSDVKHQDGVLTFTRLDEALPMPLPKEASVVLPHGPILEDLSRYTLRVGGLKAGNYDVLVDGEKTATATAEQLAAGLNLTDLPNPVTRQVGELMGKVVQKNNLYFERWRRVQVPAIVAGQAEAAETTAKLEDASKRIAVLEAEIEALRKPRPHKFEIRPA